MIKKAGEQTGGLKMKMLRFSLGKTRMDKIRNEDIRKTMGVDELGGKLRETRRVGHVVRREEGYVVKRMWKFVVGRRRGRPKRC